jgi:membrane associated rhomboid family serine protease
VSQRRALGVLFFFLGTALAGVAVYAFSDEQWVIAFASGVIALWLASMGLRGLRS